MTWWTARGELVVVHVAAFVCGGRRCRAGMRAMGLEDSSIWMGFLRDVFSRRPPVRRAAFRR